MRQRTRESKSREGLCRIEPCDLIRRMTRIQPQQDSDQPSDDVGVGIASKRQHTLWLCLGHQPDLAGAASDLVAFRPLRIGKRIKIAPQFDHIAVALFPIAKHLEFIDEFAHCVFDRDWRRHVGGNAHEATIEATSGRR